MNASNLPEMPLVESVLHLSDFSEASENAFAHALVVSLFRKTDFTIMHAGGKNVAGDEWRK
jgi:hypothetical protein